MNKIKDTDFRTQNIEATITYWFAQNNQYQWCKTFSNKYLIEVNKSCRILICETGTHTRYRMIGDMSGGGMAYISSCLDIPTSRVCRSRTSQLYNYTKFRNITSWVKFTKYCEHSVSVMLTNACFWQKQK